MMYDQCSMINAVKRGIADISVYYTVIKAFLKKHSAFYCVDRIMEKYHFSQKMVYESYNMMYCICL